MKINDHLKSLFKQKKTTDWRLVNQSLRRRTDEKIIRLCNMKIMQYPCQFKNKINKIEKYVNILFDINRLKFFLQSKLSAVNLIARPYMRQLGSNLLTVRSVFQ